MTKQESEGLGDALRRRGSILQTIRAVAWSFFGVRKSSEYEKDIGQLNPLHVVIAGLVLAALFVVALLLVVKWVLSSGVTH